MFSKYLFNKARQTKCQDIMSDGNSQEVSSNEWEFITMTKQEEDLIYRIHRLVGDSWDLIAGRIPGRNADEIGRFWIMRHGPVFAEKK